MKSTGTLYYGQNSNYLVLNCCPELGKLYRSLFYLEVYKIRKIQRPLWGEHITIIRNEDISDKSLWNKYQDEVVEFEYIPPVEFNRYYFWIPVICPRFSEIRVELGLTPEPICPYHVTIGNEVEKPPDYEINPNY